MITHSIDQAPKKSKGPKFTFELVQILRGLAALLVVGYHTAAGVKQYSGTTPAKGLFAFGLFGVDFFFVLSGFIITFIHLSDIRGKRSVVPFFKKRFFRVYPIYWFVALIVFAYLLFVEKGKLEYTGHVLSWSSFADWSYVIRSFLLIPQPAISIVDVSWTLSFEVAFYLMFAIAITLGWKYARVMFFIWVSLILSLAFGIWHSGNFYVNFILNPLIIEFLVGCLLAYIFREEKIKMTLGLFFIFSALLVAGAFFYLKVLHHQLGREGWNYLLIIGASVLALWTSATIDKSRRFTGIKWGPLLLIGNASYSIYLTHTLIIRILFEFVARYLNQTNIQTSALRINLLFFCVALISVIMGVLVHKFIEQPLLDYTNRKFVPERSPKS